MTGYLFRFSVRQNEEARESGDLPWEVLDEHTNTVVASGLTHREANDAADRAEDAADEVED